MLTRLLHRLQGRAAPAVAADFDRAPDAALHGQDEAAEDATCVDAALLASAFVGHLLDAPAAATIEPGLADDILYRLDLQAQRLDVARLPRLPAMVPQLLAALRRDDRDVNSLPALLMRDPTLAGAVVRVANSAHYRRGAQVTSLPQAIAVLGNDGLRYVVLTSVMRPILQSDPSQHAARSSERLTLHAEARTWLCGALAPGVCDGGEAQLASVVASTGVAALMRMMPRPLLAQASADPSFAPRFFALASALSARAAVQWRLDDGLRDALQSMSLPADDGSPLARTLAVADRLSMLHALRVAGGIDEVAHVSAGVANQRRDTRLLADLQAMESEPVDA